MFFSFDIGDFLIHQKYGIGRFIGIQHIVINDTSLDFFKVAYLNDSFLLIPSYNIGVFKFHSSKDAGTRMDILGRSSFLKKQQKIKDAIATTACELLQIYKARESITVQSFVINDDYLKICAAFPFELTKGQFKAIDEIIHDLSLTKPMDRLLCGDVGFGKTEVAARAIALVLSNGYKAIFIVPTTILASQHFFSLKKRFDIIGKTCEVLSKLNEHSSRVKKAWQNGEIDLLITTAHHRGLDHLLRNDLGLIVLDEEHHFGVKFKEKIRLKTHSLQLSATPIPRTLHLALSHIKDISLIETPPLGRKETQIFLVSFNEFDLQKIVLSEIANGGKIFLVVPRVQFIDEVKNLVHFAPFVVLHGQLSKEEISRSLDDFTNGDVHVLISTNIIESGLNILSANLIIIFYAHMFGVAQLHQLKGRVGRADSQGAVYFVLPSAIKDLSAERIHMIQKNSSIGGGFSLSLQDMDLRGSGTVVGHRQSGKDYGFGAEMYFEMLSECLGSKIFKKEDNKIAWVGFSNAFISSDYIVDDKIRFSFYKKLSLLSSLSELNAIIQDLSEFGDFNESLFSFLTIVKINLLSNYLTLTKVIKLNDTIEIFYNNIPLEVFLHFKPLVFFEPEHKKFSLKIEKLDFLLIRLESL